MEATCHCEDHTGVEAEQKNQREKLRVNCSSTTDAHKRIDLCVTAIQFRWFFGILVTVFIIISGFQYRELNNIGKGVSEIDKTVAVLVEKVKNIEENR